MLGLVVTAIPIAFGLAVMALGARALRTSRRRRGWASVAGTIRTSSVSRREVNVPLLGKTTLRKTGLTFGHAPRVTYAYAVDGTDYTGTRVGAAPQGGSRRRDRGWDLALFDEGRAVTVHHDPANPADSVIYPGPSSGRGPVLLFFVGGVFVAFGLMAWSILGRI